MNDDSLDKLMREKAEEHKSLYPSSWPNADFLWKSLDEKLHRRKTQRLWWSTAAAVLIAVMAGSFLFRHRFGPADGIEKVSSLSVKEKDALEFIEMYCAQKNISCAAPAIQELRSDLEKSFKKLEEIDDELELYGDDDELIRAKARIESHQARLIKTIVQTL